ncbi:hypothetical protein F7725_022638 [Dissostichus mawsoni]|uniref:Uncharacterized protein n=1 Tax=Dissostichus mawsoni TaxID=36200 RepID=A0A7J5YZG1_DISMA|nr:hypothetical protein F7725_022638 [Dissostichus mawsoni]
MVQRHHVALLCGGAPDHLQPHGGADDHAFPQVPDADHEAQFVVPHGDDGVLAENERLCAPMGLRSFHEDAAKHNGVNEQPDDVLYDQDDDGRYAFLRDHPATKADGHLHLYGEEESGGEGVDVRYARDKLFVCLMQVAVRKGNEPPDHPEEEPAAQEGHAELLSSCLQDGGSCPFYGGMCAPHVASRSGAKSQENIFSFSSAAAAVTHSTHRHTGNAPKTLSSFSSRASGRSYSWITPRFITITSGGEILTAIVTTVRSAKAVITTFCRMLSCGDRRRFTIKDNKNRDLKPAKNNVPVKLCRVELPHQTTAGEGRSWWSSLATLRPVHSTATAVARHRTMPRQHSTLNTDRYHECQLKTILGKSMQMSLSCSCFRLLGQPVVDGDHEGVFEELGQEEQGEQDDPGGGQDSSGIRQRHFQMFQSGGSHAVFSCNRSPSSSSSVLAASLEYMALRRFFLSISVILAASVSWRINKDKYMILLRILKVINHRLKLLVLSVHQGFPLLKEVGLGVLNVFQSPFSLDSAILHGNDLIKTYRKELEDAVLHQMVTQKDEHDYIHKCMWHLAPETQEINVYFQHEDMTVLRQNKVSPAPYIQNTPGCTVMMTVKHSGSIGNKKKIPNVTVILTLPDLCQLPLWKDVNVRLEGAGLDHSIKPAGHKQTEYKGRQLLIQARRKLWTFFTRHHRHRIRGRFKKRSHNGKKSSLLHQSIIHV